jgi:serine/threonine protein kinase
VHKDLKPANIFVKENGCIKLGDFGISQRQEEGQVNYGGTLPYMSPEMFKIRGNIGPKTDIWSMGVVVFQLLE